MIDPKVVTQQLRQVGCDYMLWGNTETRELHKVLMDGEQIKQAVNGYYDGGFALLCVTNFRVLVVDKKPFLLTVEDLRYDMIAEVDYSARIFTSILHVYTPLRTLVFTSWSTARLRKSMNYIQQRVMEMRNNDFLASQFTQQAMPQQQAPQRTQIKETPFAGHGTQHIPQMVPTYHGTQHPIAQFDEYKHPAGASQSQAEPLQTEQTEMPEASSSTATVPYPHPQPLARRLVNPYTKVPLLARRRKYPSFY